MNREKTSPRATSAAAGGRGLELGSWIVLLLASSPVIVQLAGAVARTQEHRHAIIGWLLLALALRLTPAEPAAPRVAGLGVAAVGAVVQLIGVVVGSWSVARLGLPLAVCGLALRFGRPSLPTALVSIWALPLPATVIALLKPLSIHGFLTEWSTALYSVLGVPIEIVGRAVQTPDAILHVTSRHGWVLAYVLAGLGWYAAARSGGSLREAVFRAVRWAVWAIPLLAVAILVAIGLLSLGGTKLAVGWLHRGWLLVGLVGLALIERRLRTDTR